MLRAGWGAAEGQVEDEDEEGKVKEDEDNMRWRQDSRSALLQPASWEIWCQDWIQEAGAAPGPQSSSQPPLDSHKLPHLV